MNSFEDEARARKVLAILSVVPCGRDTEEIAKVAVWLRDIPQQERDALTAQAGVRPASQTTWDEVVKAAAARRSVSEMFPVTYPGKLVLLQGGKATG